ncbi:methyltransferase domain protein, partial [Oesophagostomum dentatum]
HFPKSNFTGVDVSHEAIRLAEQLRKPNGGKYDNLTFMQMDGSKLDESWTSKFDLVTIFDACHDQMRPDLCLKEIHRVLKPGGVFGMVEVDGTSHIFKDKQQLGEIATMNYCASLFNCLPLGSNSKEALGLGSMWGRERAAKMLKEAGFNDVTIVPTPYFETNVLYVSKKD